MDTQCYAHSDQGRRKNNEDAFAYFEPTDLAELKSRGCLYIVADGVGGAAKGERASQYAAEKVRYEYYQPYDDPETPGQPEGLIEPLGYLRAILQRVNEDIFEFATQRDTRMATTIVLAVIRGGWLYYANVGDSRAYLIRNGAATQLTNDHSFVGEMVQHGEMTEAEAMASSIKNRLTRSLGGDPEVVVETYPPLQLIEGDKILLCSDGLTRYATSEQVANMSTVGKPEEIVNRFIKFANDSGGADNVTVALVVYKPNWALAPISPSHRPQKADLKPTSPSINDQKTIVLDQKAFIPIANNRERKQWLALGITGSLIAVIAAFIGGMALMIQRNRDVIGNPTIFASTNIVSVLSPTPLNITSNVEVPTIETPPASAGVTVGEPNPASAGVVVEPTSLQGNLDGNYLCVAKIDVTAPTLWQILGKFDQQYDVGGLYYHCTLDDSQTTCKLLDQITNNEKGNPIVHPGWWIVIDKIDQAKCNQGNGIWVWVQKP